MSNPRITALVHTRNEEANLPQCLASLTWADEMVVADMASTDTTREIAAKLGARVIEVPMADCVEKVRNQAIDACTGDWILILDADETIAPGLVSQLPGLMAQSDGVGAYALPRKNYFLGVWLEHGLWPDHQVRFIRRGKVRWSGLVHELPEVGGEMVRLKPDPEAALEHFGHAPNLKWYMDKMARYAPMDAQRLAATSRPAVWPYMIRRPVGEFCGRYFACGAWRHGMEGLVWSLVAANYQLQVCLHYWAAHRDEVKLAPETVRKQIKREIWREAFKWLRH
ncbi:MAG TPA: glycosyltransferase family 2 protein [Roseimicrobium sp.]|nr:glycosyltransferase family 2 protein [Roseimicrobium sp.]